MSSSSSSTTTSLNGAVSLVLELMERHKLLAAQPQSSQSYQDSQRILDEARQVLYVTIPADPSYAQFTAKRGAFYEAYQQLRSMVDTQSKIESRSSDALPDSVAGTRASGEPVTHHSRHLPPQPNASQTLEKRFESLRRPSVVTRSTMPISNGSATTNFGEEPRLTYPANGSAQSRIYRNGLNSINSENGIAVDSVASSHSQPSSIRYSYANNFGANGATEPPSRYDPVETRGGLRAQMIRPTSAATPNPYAKRSNTRSESLLNPSETVNTVVTLRSAEPSRSKITHPPISYSPSNVVNKAPSPSTHDISSINGTIVSLSCATVASQLERTLLLDVRRRDAFEACHINGPLISCIQPVSLRPGISTEELEDTLVIAPLAEQESFSLRNSVEYVVLYDDNSDSTTQSTALRYIVEALYKSGIRSYTLRGGISAWLKEFPEGLMTYYGSDAHRSVGLKMPTPPARPPPPPVPKPPASLRASSLHNRILLDPSFNQSTPSLVSSMDMPSAVIQRYSPPLPPHPNHYYTQKNAPALPPKVPEYPKVSCGQHLRPDIQPQASSLLSGRQQQEKPQQYQNHYQQLPHAQSQSGTSLRGKFAPQSDLVALSCTTGLRNLGNTCYMNCVIQCLLGVAQLVLPFINTSYRQRINIRSRMGYKGQLAEEFATLVRAIAQPGVSFVAPNGLKALAGNLVPNFAGYEQQDCQEFLTFILDGLHEDLNANGHRPRAGELDEHSERKRERMSPRAASAIEWERYLASDTSLVVDIFQGQVLSRLQCTLCGTTSTTYNAFSTLSLPIPHARRKGGSVNLRDCFDEFVKDETLDGENAWHCPQCKVKRRALKTLRISHLPEILVVHLTRFRRTITGVDKLETPVHYPLKGLNLTAYWPSCAPNDSATAEILSQLPNRGQNPPFIYDLCAVTLHSGTLKGGHYTAVVYKPLKGWCYFDDTAVTAVGEQAALSRSAYVLFYRRRL